MEVKDRRGRMASAACFLTILLAILASSCSKDNPSQPKIPKTQRSLAFSPRTPIPLGILWGTIAAGDFDRDGHLDLVASAADTPVVYLLLGNGDGSFGAPTHIPIPARADLVVDVVGGDWDHDGNPDVGCNCYYATVFLYGRGNGSFDSTLIARTTSVVQGSASAGDFNGDGIDDYASFDRGTAVVITGDSRRMHRRIVSDVPPVIGWNPTFGASGDLDADGKVDIALIRGVSPDHASIYYGNGDGTLRLPVGLSDAGANYGICTLGRSGGGPGRDLVIAHQSLDSVGVFRTVGGALAAEVNYRVAGSPCGLASADFDLDGIEDLAVACPNGEDIAILLGQKDGTFVPGTYIDMGMAPWRLTIADLNGDGLPDVAAVGTQAICVLINSSK